MSGGLDELDDFFSAGQEYLVPGNRRKNARLMWRCGLCPWRSNRWQSPEKLHEQIEEHRLDHLEAQL